VSKELNKKWPSVPLGNILTERKEKPSLHDILTGKTRIVSKISFDNGQIQLRSDCKTKTGMILIKPGDLVLSGINACKGAIAIYDEHSREPISATIHYGAYVPHKDKAEIEFLWWLLRSEVFRDILDQHLPGGIKTELRAKRFLRIPIPLPPLPEQRRIVAKVKNITRTVQSARNSRRESIEKLQEFFQAAIEKHAIRFYKRLEILSSIFYHKPKNGYSARCNNLEEGIPVLSLTAIKGFLYKPIYKYTSEPLNPQSHYWLHPGDLLISRSNTLELVGHAAIYSGEPYPCIHPDLMMKLFIDEKKANKKFVLYWLQTPVVRRFIADKAQGTSPTMKKISQRIVMQIPFPMGIKINEQCRIVAHLDNLQEEMYGIKRLQYETQSELDALIPSIVAKAFRGELV